MWVQLESVFCIRKIFNGSESKSSDPYPDFTDPDPDPTHHLAIFNKYNFFKRHISDKKFSYRQIKATGDWMA
jgi:hypothetical protein